MPTQTITSPIPPDQAFRSDWQSAEQNAVLAFAREVAQNWPGDADNVLLDGDDIPGIPAGTLVAGLVALKTALETYTTNALAGHASTDSHGMYLTEARHATLDHTGIPGVGPGGGGGGVTDHGALTGLADDDHTQYYNLSRLNTWLAGQSINAATLQGNAATAFATAAHNHTSSAITDFASAVTTTVNTLARDDVVWAGGASPNNSDGRQNGSWTVTQSGVSVSFWEKLSGTYTVRFTIADITSAGGGGGGGDDPRIPDGSAGDDNVGVPVWQNATANFDVRPLTFTDIANFDDAVTPNNGTLVWNDTADEVEIHQHPVGRVGIVGYNGTNWVVKGLNVNVVRGDAGRTTPMIFVRDSNDPDPTADAGLTIDYDIAMAASGAIV